MRAFLLAFALAMPAMAADEHEHMHELPHGGGAQQNLGAWLRIDVDGIYEIPQTTVWCGEKRSVMMGLRSPMILKAGRVYRVLPWSGTLLWRPPGGAMQPVPEGNLIPVYPQNVGPQRCPK